jgi:hypothetical protein
MLILVLALPLTVSNVSAATTYTIIQITDNDYDDMAPQIHNGQITWRGFDPIGFDWDIFLYDSASGVTTQITDNDIWDHEPRIHDGQITWIAYDGNDYEIFFATPVVEDADVNLKRIWPSSHRSPVDTPITLYAEFELSDVDATLKLHFDIDKKNPETREWEPYTSVESTWETLSPGKYTRSMDWTPSEAGSYRVTGYIIYDSQQSNSKIIHHIGIYEPR